MHKYDSQLQRCVKTICHLAEDTVNGNITLKRWDVIRNQKSFNVLYQLLLEHKDIAMGIANIKSMVTLEKLNVQKRKWTYIETKISQTRKAVESFHTLCKFNEIGNGKILLIICGNI